jgi:Outer membrane protein beta-barrel domain
MLSVYVWYFVNLCQIILHSVRFVSTMNLTNTQMYFIQAKMKNIFFASVLILLQFMAHAQDAGLSVSVAAGPSISLRKFATQISGQTRAELAGNGWAGQLNVNYNVWRSLGITAQVSYNQNATRTEPLIKSAGDYNITDPVVLAKNWDALNFMAGPTLRLLDRTLVFDGRLLAGYSIVNSPEFLITGKFSSRDATIQTLTNPASAFAFGMGSTLGYNFNDRLSVVVNADYMQSSMTFKDIVSKISLVGINQSLTRTEDQTVGLLNVTAGVKFSF